MSENTEPNVENIEAMFVQCARGMTSRDGTVTFQGPADSTLFFADRLQRVVGHPHTVAALSPSGFAPEFTWFMSMCV
jgi:hypothetical protein